MTSAILNPVRSFGTDNRGSVAALFGLMLTSIIFLAGIAIDFGRATHADRRLTASIDAAALAAGRWLLDGNLTDEEIELQASKLLKDNFNSSGSFGELTDDPVVELDRATNRVRIDVKVAVPTTLAGITGYTQFNLPRTTSVAFGQQDLELALALDITGSMAGSKIADLKAAASEMVTQLLPDKKRPNKVRIALAPYSAAINLGAFAAPASDNASKDGCVYERTGADKYTDAVPTAVKSSTFFKAGGKPKDIDPTEGIPSNSYQCPGATIVPMTDDAATLKRAINNLTTGGYTAGHFGAAWAWYLVSEKWSAFWPADAAPAVSSAQTTKAIVLMTDGIFNTSYANGKSSDQAIELCKAMKARELDADGKPKSDTPAVLVYTVAFQAPPAAEATLKACATSERHHFEPKDRDELVRVFVDIASHLQTLRVTQ